MSRRYILVADEMGTSGMAPGTSNSFVFGGYVVHERHVQRVCQSWRRMKRQMCGDSQIPGGRSINPTPQDLFARLEAHVTGRGKHEMIRHANGIDVRQRICAGSSNRAESVQPCGMPEKRVR